MSVHSADSEDDGTGRNHDRARSAFAHSTPGGLLVGGANADAATSRADDQTGTDLLSWLQRRPAAAFLLLIVVSAVNLGLFLQNIRVVQSNSAWVAKTHEALRLLDQIPATLWAMEAGGRGYLLTNDTAYLTSTDAVVAESNRHFQALESLLVDAPDQTARLQTLRARVQAKIDESTAVIRVREADGPGASSRLIVGDVDDRTMAEVETLVRDMKTHELNLLQRREAAAAAGYQVAVASAVLAALGSVAIFCIAWRLIAKELRARQQAQADADEQRQRLSVTLASIGDAVICVDTQGRITYVNAAAEATTGWTAAEALGKPLEQIYRVVAETDRRTLENPVEKALRTGATVGLEYPTVLLRKDGGEASIDDGAAPLRNADGRTIGAVLVFRDISARRRVERAEEEQKKQLQEAEQRKDAFLATLAHELRNPLAPLANALQLMSLEDTDHADYQALRELMERQVRQLTRLIDDLLDVARIAHGKLALQRETIELDDALTTAIDIARPLIDAGRHTFAVQRGERPVYVSGDNVRLSQVFANLLNNAAKFTPGRGRIRLTVEREGTDVLVRVGDSGPGVPENRRQHIFEPFVQIDPTLTRTHGGLGVGLSLSKKIVELHGGSITAGRDETLGGSEMTVRLPTAAAPKTSPAGKHVVADAARPTANGTRRILVVDDLQSAAFVLTKLLEKLGHSVETRLSGSEALETFQQRPFDLVISDVGMPGMSGCDLATAIRALPGSQDVYLAALTGYGQERDAERIHEAGFDFHLVKPVSMEKLKEVLAATLQPRGVSA